MSRRQIGQRPSRTSPRRNRIGPRSDWPFSRPATLARELTARVFGPVVRWMVCGPTVVGREHLAAIDGAFLVCANHSSHFDTSTLRLALGPRLRHRLAIAAAADYFWRNRLLAFLAGWLGSFPFNREGSGGSQSIKAIERLLGQGWGVLVYPEGTRSRTGAIGRFKPGPGLVAVRTECQVLPARIVGSYEVLPPGSHWPRRSRVEVRFGAPMRARLTEDARAFTERLEAAVRAL
jgi:1-acyl-sn-glycerol-3-phosphate acyltransferase